MPAAAASARVRPATAADAAASGLDDLQPDRWRDGGNRRSFVAVDASGVVLGHCRGIDNTFHPGSRMLVLDATPEGWEDGAADALLEAQIGVSTLSLRLKLRRSDQALMALALRHGAVVEQLCPPWQRIVGPELRSWAARHRSPEVEPARADDADDLLDLWVDHYTAQHASWSPAAPASELRAEFAADFEPGSEDGHDLSRARVLRRDGRIAAAALVWPGDDEVEVTLFSRPYEGPTTASDKAACLAAVVADAADGEVLALDSHVTEPVERDLIASVPGLPPDAADDWCVLVAVPVPGGVVRQLRPDAVPADIPAWVARLVGNAP